MCSFSFPFSIVTTTPLYIFPFPHLSLSLSNTPHAPCPPPLMRPMGSNGMASSPSSFFPPNFLLQMQQTPPDHDPQEHHHHLSPPLLHPHHNPFLSSSQCPSLQEFRGTHMSIDRSAVDSSMALSLPRIDQQLNILLTTLTTDDRGHGCRYDADAGEAADVRR
jgi:hypothetical protein